MSGEKHDAKDSALNVSQHRSCPTATAIIAATQGPLPAWYQAIVRQRARWSAFLAAQASGMQRSSSTSVS